MNAPIVLCADGDADASRAAVETAGGRLVVLAGGVHRPPPDARAWERSISELALCQWLLLASRGATEAVLEACGAPPGPVVRIAAVDAAAVPLRAAGRRPDVTADALRPLLARLGALGRRQRVLAPHVHGGGREIAAWLRARGAEPVAVAAYEIAVPEADNAAGAVADAVALIAGTPDTVELLQRGLETARPGAAAAVPLAALTAAAEDAARDCGFARARRVGADLAPFLAAALRPAAS